MTDTRSDNLSELKPLVNKVAQSNLITIDLEKFYPSDICELDLKDFLFRGMLLKEKEFRTKIDAFDRNTLADKNVAVFCSSEALIQQWAWMLVASKLQGIAREVYFGTKDEVLVDIYTNTIRNLDVNEYADKRVIIKGCSAQQVPDAAYLEISKKLLPIVKSLMFGEACSTVPVFKKK